MTVQFSVEVRNARLDAIETVIGAAPKLRIYSGAPPANTAAAATGTLLVDMTLPSDFLAAASGGAKTLSGTWAATGAANGVAGHYRIWNAGLTLCHEQGTVGQGTGDLSLDNTNIATGQAVNITTFTKTDNNA